MRLMPPSCRPSEADGLRAVLDVHQGNGAYGQRLPGPWNGNDERDGTSGDDTASTSLGEQSER